MLLFKKIIFGLAGLGTIGLISSFVVSCSNSSTSSNNLDSSSNLIKAEAEKFYGDSFGIDGNNVTLSSLDESQIK